MSWKENTSITTAPLILTSMCHKKNPIGRLVGGDEILLSQTFFIIHLWHRAKCASQFHFQEANDNDECWIQKEFGADDESVLPGAGKFRRWW